MAQLTIQPAPLPELPQAFVAASSPADARAALGDHPYAALLGRVDKPGRYLGGEEQAVIKPADGRYTCRFVLAFPDVYEVGMSHLGTKILYDLVNRSDDLVCERAFSPWLDMEAALREAGLPLVSLETYTPLREFDAVGFSLQYELCYSNVLLNLDLGGIPLLAAERSDADPIVLAGGPTATHPEPLATIVDALLVGEAEEVLPPTLRLIGQMRADGRSRADILGAIARSPGWYVPRFYRVELDPRTDMLVVVGRTAEGEAQGAPELVERVYVRDLDAFPFPERAPVPYAEAIFDRAAVEITRGCTEGCRFCQAGIIYRPVRERSPAAIKRAVLAGLDNAGYDETSMTALSTADVSCIEPLVTELAPELRARKAKLGVSSLRAYGLSEALIDTIHDLGVNGLTFAPEAGTQRMRDVINKNVSDEDILRSARRIFERGMDRIKMYFIMGLPTETDEDVVGIIETGRSVRAVGRQVAREQGHGRAPQVTVSVSQHVPKPHTPFQWAAMDAMEDLESKVRMLRTLAKDAKIGIKTHDVRESWLECLFARGDRRMGDVLLTAYRAGARFDGWREGFDFRRWLDALEAHGIRPEVFTRTLPVGARLPWDHLDIGLEPGFLEGEYRKALASRVSPPCGKPAGAKVHHGTVAAAEAEARRLVCYDCGIACDMTAMREERIVALRSLSDLTQARMDAQVRDEAAAEARAQARTQAEAAGLVSVDRLRSLTARSKLADGAARKAAAEAPHSRLRLFFAKTGTLRFLGHRDLLRVLPRMFRRAGIELAFSRGFNPIPRMTFAPALPLGVAADQEVADVDVLLEGVSDRDLSGAMTDAEREAIAAELVARLAAVAPPGMRITAGRLVAPGEHKLGELIVAADWAVRLEPHQLARAQAAVAVAPAARSWVVERQLHAKGKGRGRRPDGPQTRAVDVAQVVEHPRVVGEHLLFRMRLDGEGGARPREVVQALIGEPAPDHAFTRTRLLARHADGLVAMADLGPAWRPTPPPRPRATFADGPAPAAE